MKIVFAADHVGFELKNVLMVYVKNLGYETEDFGAFEFNKDDDYPDFVSQAAKAVSNDPDETKGIILGGNGQGEAVVANRFKGVRAAVFYGSVVAKKEVDISGKKSDDPYEIVRLSREHDDANMLSLGARFIGEEDAKEAVRIFIETPFSGAERHVRRIRKVESLVHSL